jgi:SAM-dependent methyltransferase
MGAALKARLRELVRRKPESAPVEPPPEPPPPPPLDWSQRDVPPAGIAAQPVSTRLVERLRPEDVAAAEGTVGGDWRALWEQTPAPYRGPLVLCFGVWAEIPGVLERTGLVKAEPPPEVHAMSRGPLAAGGDYYSADIVVEALERAGGDIDAVRRGLDFGCSSGRTLRVLAAAYPDVEWHGVDPNADATTWAGERLPGARFDTSDSDPPLAFPDAYFDLAYAISIWSHFAEPAALAWLDEMHRVVRPGGHLVITVHALQSVAFYGQHGLRPREQLHEIARALHRSGFWYAPEFGATGDFGVVHPHWGTAFMSQEWLLRHATPAWHVASYAVGRNMDNQDVAVLRRSAPTDGC